MRVLHVIHGVVVALRFREIEIEIEVLIRAACAVEEPCSIAPDLVDELGQRDELTCARRHRDLLALPVQHRELHEQDLELVRVEPHGLQRRTHARNVSVMIGAPDIDQVVETPLVLVAVIRDIGREVGRAAVVTHDDAVFLVAERGAPEPLRALVRVNVVVFLQ